MKISDTVQQLIKMKSDIPNDSRDASGLPDSFKISELSTLSEIAKNDLMLVSNPLQMNVYRSYRMEYDTVSTDLKITVSCLPNTTLSGAWTVRGHMVLPTKRINEEDDDQVVNCDWLSTRFLRELRQLSSEIYEKNHIQSFIGEVIYSTTLKTEEQVRKKYGQETSWERIEGRFIMATQTAAYVDKTTGDFSSPLSLVDAPKHSHNISFEDNKKTYNLNWNIPLTPSTICGADSKSTGKEVERSMGQGWTMRKLTRNITEDMLWTSGLIEAARENGWADGRVAVAYGRGPSHGQGNAYILANRGENRPHNNIPPFYTVHVWKRVR